MESSQQRQTRLQDISARKAISSQLETLEKRAMIYHLFFNLFTLVIFMKVDNISHIVDVCAEFCILKKEFLNLTINIQLLHFITTVISQVHSARYIPSACGLQCSTECLVSEVVSLSLGLSGMSLKEGGAAFSNKGRL